jgi:hypothetical protein
VQPSASSCRGSTPQLLDQQANHAVLPGDLPGQALSRHRLPRIRQPFITRVGLIRPREEATMVLAGSPRSEATSQPGSSSSRRHAPSAENPS